MIIKHIHIDNFGKFSDYDLDLSDSFNVIYGNNEDGKSTLMAFIKMVFYGHNGKSSDIQKNPRLQYQPWQGGVMKGYIDFSADNINYRIERSFGRSNTSDDIAVWNLDSGMKLQLARGRDPGQEFFGLGSEGFEKSVFIGQSGSVINNSGKEDEITQRLLNLVTTGDEKTSFKSVSDQLTGAVESLVSKRGDKGLLAINKKNLEELGRDRAAAEAAEIDKQQEIAFIKQLTSQKLMLEDEINELSKQVRAGDLTKQRDRLIEIIKRRQDIETNTRQIENMQKDLNREEINLDEAYVENCERIEQDIDRLTERLKEYQIALSKEQTILAQIKNEDIREVSQEELNSLREKQVRLELLKKEASRLDTEIGQLEKIVGLFDEAKLINDDLKNIDNSLAQLKLQETENRKIIDGLREQIVAAEAELSEITGILNTTRQRGYEQKAQLENAKRELEKFPSEADEKISFAKERLEDARKPRSWQEDIPAGREFKKTIFFIGLIVLVAGILAGSLVEPLLFLLTAAGAVLLIMSYRKTPARTLTRSDLDEKLIEKCEFELDEVQKRCEKQNEALKKTVDECLVEYRNSQQEITSYEQQAADKLEQTKVLTAQYDSDAEAYQDVKMKIESAKSRREPRQEQLLNLQREIDEAITVYISLRADLSAENLISIFEKIKQSSFSNEISAELLAEIKKLNNKAQQKQQDIETLEELIKESLANYQAEDVETVSVMVQKWKNFCVRLQAQEERVKEADNKTSECRDLLSVREQDFINSITIYEPVTDLKQANEKLQQLKIDIKALARKSGELIAKVEALSPEAADFPIEELETQVAQIAQELAGLPENVMSSEELERIHTRIGECDKEIKKLAGEIISREAAICEKYRNLPNVSQIDDQIEQVSELVVDQEFELSTLQLAREILNESFEEVQRSFGPLVNDSTAQIFNQLTNGRYRNVRVSRDLNITVENSVDRSLRDWAYLSSGTIDQAYLALRLAITDLITDGRAYLPLLLDDIFTMYDDERAYEGMKFLAAYRSDNDRRPQILLFTCHNRISEWGKQTGAAHHSLS